MIISLVNQKGGVGKTTHAFNLAHAFKSLGRKVLCLDLDPQANLSLLFDIDKERESDNDSHLFHLLVNSLKELKALHTPVVFSDIVERKNGVDILPAGQELSGLELTVANINYPRPLILKNFIEKNNLHRIYDHIIIDSPPTLGLLMVNIMCASDGLVVPFRADGFSKKGLHHLYSMLEDVADMGIVKKPEIFAFVPNLVDERRKVETEDLKLIAESIEHYSRNDSDKITQPFANKIQLMRAQNLKKSVFDFAAQEYDDLKGHFQKMACDIEKFKH